MPIVLAAAVALGLVALLVMPAWAARQTAAVDAPPTQVAAVDSYLKLDSSIKLDSTLTGLIKFDLGKYGDKWHISKLKCDDVTVVAADAGRVVAKDTAHPGTGDAASCVYSMKVPSGQNLSVYAVLGSPQSVGIKGFLKLDKGGFDTKQTDSDLKTQGFLKLDQYKSGLQTIKLTSGAQQTLPLYLKLDQTGL